jgi:hypothetical protein
MFLKTLEPDGAERIGIGARQAPYLKGSGIRHHKSLVCRSAGRGARASSLVTQVRKAAKFPVSALAFPAILSR